VDGGQNNDVWMGGARDEGDGRRGMTTTRGNKRWQGGEGTMTNNEGDTGVGSTNGEENDNRGLSSPPPLPSGLCFIHVLLFLFFVVCTLYNRVWGCLI
jgi:hypothetical protein